MGTGEPRHARGDFDADERSDGVSARPLRVLIVEDEVLVAMELAALVEELGHVVVGHALDSGEALQLMEFAEADLALVDLHLQDGPTGVMVGRKLVERCGAMVLFMTANQKRVPDDFAGAVGLLAKPYSLKGVEEALNYLRDCATGDCAPSAAPQCLTLAPDFRRRWKVDEAPAVRLLRRGPQAVAH
jgi:CheY-like chemotaxis protein